MEKSLESECPGENKNPLLAGFIGCYPMQWRFGEQAYATKL
jgi:hypothetical protein